MLRIAHRVSEISACEIKKVYSGGFSKRELDRFMEYLEQEFFSVRGAMCCIWCENMEYYSALRLEPYLDGMLLTGVETTPKYRRMGYGKKLLQSTIQYLKDNNPCRLYCHIELNNTASLLLHKQSGFTQLLDYARYIDGTVTSNAVTMVLDME